MAASCSRGAPRDLYFRPRTRFAAEFLGKANLIPVQFAASADGTQVRARGAEVALATLTEAPVAMRDPWAMVRPEAWRIVDGGTGGIDATVEDATFIGDRLVVRAGTQIGSQTVSTGGFHLVAPGDRISLAVAPDRVQLIDMHAS